MRCPFCGHGNTSVKDSRAADDNTAIRRRRHCDECGARFTTIEHVQLLPLKVIKSNGRIEEFNRDKLAKAVKLALHKRPIEADRVEKFINSMIRQLESKGETEINSKYIGELAMESLYELDSVAYIRFASVYKDFDVAGDFKHFVKSIESKNVEST